MSKPDRIYPDGPNLVIAQGGTTTVYPPQSRIAGKDYELLSREIKRRYLVDGHSVRRISADLNRSYGYVLRMLQQRTDVKVRGRGGAGQAPQRDANMRGVMTVHHQCASSDASFGVTEERGLPGDPRHNIRCGAAHAATAGRTRPR
ncbi:MAG: hypothetical protein JWQ81_5942 [Amycolatopsis sp.]|jgi:hypothetical protein|uniref:helix-turn-helix domain-containing protein n=1 Tax=Amycolatopsis sp. TaxID=37632 RepID=UPI00260E37E8|nr:helix-turn-helix domain-containing protein [Amycolatopsis sp.]MCU1685203.1 hypothetical protein [Amycolatopsis sp.]